MKIKKTATLAIFILMPFSATANDISVSLYESTLEANEEELAGSLSLYISGLGHGIIAAHKFTKMICIPEGLSLTSNDFRAIADAQIKMFKEVEAGDEHRLYRGLSLGFVMNLGLLEAFGCD